MSELPPNQQVDSVLGPLVLLRDDHVLAPIVRDTGQWEPAESAALAALIAPGASVVELGAHCGYLTVLMAKAAGPRGRVLALEPHPDNFALLRENVRRHGLDNVELVQAAAWHESGPLDLILSTANTGDHRVYERTGDDVGGRMPVRAVRVDELLGGRRVDVVKVDTQGVDHLAFAGMADAARRWRPKVVTEFWPHGIRELGEDPAAVVRSYRELGYAVSVLDCPGLGASADDDAIVAATEALPVGYSSLLLHGPPPRAGMGRRVRRAVRGHVLRGRA